jgi:hypothetical protein
MKTTAFILASCALLALPLGSAGAGQCTSEIDNLARALDRETVGSSSASGGAQATKEEHPPTTIMGRETQGSAASADDAQRQTQGQPTAAQQAQGQISTSHDMAAAMAALERARLFDRHGNEAECLSAIGQAKLMSGSR